MIRLKQNHGQLARQVDRPIAAFLTDLKQRGMLDETLVVWGGEFGRTPVVEMPNPSNVNGKAAETTTTGASPCGWPGAA